MPDVIAHFLRPLPWRVKLKGEWWTISVSAQNKSGKSVAIVACTGTRSHNLWASHVGMLSMTMADGIRIKAGTPQRGLVTELRRAGLMRLTPTPELPVDDY